MSKRVKIGLISTWYGGGEKTHLDQIQAFLGKEFEFELITARPKTPWGLWQVARQIRAKQFDKLHVHGFRAGLWVRLLKRLRWIQIPVILSVHGFHYAAYTNHLKKWVCVWIERRLKSATDHLICVSQSDLGAMHQLGLLPDDYSVIPNPAPVYTQTEKPDLPFEGNAKVVLSVGSLVPIKGHLELIKVAYQTRDLGLKWVIVGDGPLRRNLQSEIERLGLSDHVYLMGAQSNMAAWYGVADYLISTSKREGCPYAILEAMAARVPVLAADVPGCRDLIRHQVNGLLYQPSHPTHLSDQIQWMVAHPDRIRGLADEAYKISLSDYGQNQFAIKLRGLYT